VILRIRIGFLIAVFVATCGPAAPTTGSYVAEFTNGAAYLAWTRTDKSVSGNFSQALWREGNASLTNEAFGATGTADGNGVSLKLDEGLGLGPTAVGTFSGDQLTLTFPSTNGKINQYTFRPTRALLTRPPRCSRRSPMLTTSRPTGPPSRTWRTGWAQ
jgi:hypothetical protein